MNRWTQVSDPRGHFDVQLIGPGVYQVQVSLDGYAWMWSPEVRFEKSGITQDIQLKPPPAGSPHRPPSRSSRKAHRRRKGDSPFDGKIRRHGIASGAASKATRAPPSPIQTAAFSSRILPPATETLKILHHDFAPVIKEKIQGHRERQVNDIGTNQPANRRRLCRRHRLRRARRPLPQCLTGIPGRRRRSWRPRSRSRRPLRPCYNGPAGPLPLRRASPAADYFTSTMAIAGITRIPGAAFAASCAHMDGQTAHLDFGGTLPVKGRLLSNSKPVPGSSIELSIVEGNFPAPVMVKATHRCKMAASSSWGRRSEDTPCFANARIRDPIGSPSKRSMSPFSPIDLGDVSNDVGDVTIAAHRRTIPPI